MVCCASTSPKAPTFTDTSPTTWPPWPPLSTAGPARRSAGRHQPRPWTSSYNQTEQAVLLRPFEPEEYPPSSCDSAACDGAAQQPGIGLSSQDGQRHQH